MFDLLLFTQTNLKQNLMFCFLSVFKRNYYVVIREISGRVLGSLEVKLKCVYGADSNTIRYLKKYYKKTALRIPSCTSISF